MPSRSIDIIKHICYTNIRIQHFYLELFSSLEGVKMSHIRWYADNSYIHGIWGAEIEDILMFGGIALDNDAERAISTIMENVKRPYKHEADFPVKWNVRDLEKYYRKVDLGDLYKAILKESKDWRRQIFREASNLEFTIIIALIKSHSSRRSIIKRNREKLTRYVFSDALMRVGHHIRETDASFAEIILDWPEQKQPRHIFDEEYKSALIQGVTCEKQEYHCGALKGLGFSDSLYFTSMKACSVLQFCDLVVGATREFVNLALEKEEETFGYDCLRKLSMKFRGAPDNVVGRGLIIAPTTGELIESVRKYIPKLFE